MYCDTADWEMFKLWAAAVMLPVSATFTKTSSALRISIHFSCMLPFPLLICLNVVTDAWSRILISGLHPFTERITLFSILILFIRINNKSNSRLFPTSKVGNQLRNVS